METRVLSPRRRSSALSRAANEVRVGLLDERGVPRAGELQIRRRLVAPGPRGAILLLRDVALFDEGLQAGELLLGLLEQALSLLEVVRRFACRQRRARVDQRGEVPFGGLRRKPGVPDLRARFETQRRERESRLVHLRRQLAGAGPGDLQLLLKRGGIELDESILFRDERALFDEREDLQLHAGDHGPVGVGPRRGERAHERDRRLEVAPPDEELSGSFPARGERRDEREKQKSSGRGEEERVPPSRNRCPPEGRPKVGQHGTHGRSRNGFTSS